MVKVSRARGMAFREAVLDATVAELAAVGPAELSISAVAARAGVATSVVYNRFSTKSRLLDQAVTERLAPRDVSATAGADRAFRSQRRPEPGTRCCWRRRGPARRSSRSARLSPGATTRSSLSRPSWARGCWPEASTGERPPRRGEPRWSTWRWGAPPSTGPSSRRPVAFAPHPPGCPPRCRCCRSTPWAAPCSTPPVTPSSPTVSPGPPSAGSPDRADTSTGAVYNRFSGKSGLLAEAHRHGLPGTATGRETEMALRIEALRVAPDDPEVSAAVAATAGRAVTLLAHDLAAPRRDGRAGAELDPRVAAWVTDLASRSGSGCWPEPSDQTCPPAPRPSSPPSVHEPPSARRSRGSVAVDEPTPGGSGGRRGSRAARRLRTGGAGAPRRGVAARVGRRGHRAHRGRQPAAQRRHPRTLRQGPRRGRRAAAGRSVPGRALRPEGPRAAQRR